MVVQVRSTGGRLNDPLNLSHKRNIRNTNKEFYNCAGYALGTFSWYMPCETADSRNFYFEDEYEAYRKTSKCVAKMLQEIPGLRRVRSTSEVLQDEYLIAFRLADGDFHFIKRDKGGHWRHKRGRSDTIETMSKREVFSNCWFSYYSGPLILLAKRG